MSVWKEYKLGEIAEIQNGYAFKSSEFAEKGVPIIKIKNIVPPGVVLDDVQFYNNDITTKLEKFVVKKKDFLISMTGSTVNQMASAVGKMARYGFSKPSLMNQRVAKIYSTSDKVIDDYLFYYLNRFDVQFELASSASGSANQANISPEQLKSYLVKVPDIKTQRGIAEILSSIDDKIELNNKINQELESLAQLLFKRWFVDFEFPIENGEPYKSSGGEMVNSELGQIPKGWRLGKFGELVDVINGYAFKSKDFDNSQEEGIVKIKNINGLTVDIKNTDFVSSNVVSNLNRKFKINSGDILIAMTGAEVGKIGVVPETKQNLWLNQRVGKVVPKDVKNTSFIHTLYNFLNLTDLVKNEAMGSAQPNISSTGIESIKILIPAQVVIEEFSRIFNDKYFLFVSSLAEIQTLSELRDTLLPKLISGELQIKDK
jgi:type I restriction enzyme S subunit